MERGKASARLVEILWALFTGEDRGDCVCGDDDTAGNGGSRSGIDRSVGGDGRDEAAMATAVARASAAAVATARERGTSPGS